MLMPASKLELPVENPSSLIRARIREKRIFEARFLYRQLGAEIGGKEKTAIERELSGILGQVKKIQQQAREYAAQGQSNLAVKLYSDIEQLAIDVPGLAEEKQALAGAEALAARITGKAVERKPEVVVPQAVVPAVSDEGEPLIAPVQGYQKRLPHVKPLQAFARVGILVAKITSQVVERISAFVSRMAVLTKPGNVAMVIAAVRNQLKRMLQLELFARLKVLSSQWLLVGLLGLVIILLFFSHSRYQGKPPLSAAPKPSLTQPPQKTPDKPLIPFSPVLANQPDKEETEQESDPIAEAATSPSSSLKVGALQIIESVRD